ncbi:MAG: DUF4249 domain-containing protein [Bacteroidota bacterium]|jgi:hypothetical protein
MQANKFKMIQLAGFIALLFATSCVEEYWPEIDASGDELLVVDGKITNYAGPYTVKLSKSFALDQPTALIDQAVTQAQVLIMDNLGNQEVLTETSKGVYQTKSNGIRGIIGRSYKVKITLNTGKIYESEFEELVNTVDVESTTFEEVIKPAASSLEKDLEGYQFYVSSATSASNQKYYYWEVEETYEYHADYKIIFLYDGKRYPTSDYNPLGLAQTRNQDTLYYCWTTRMVGQRFSYSTEYLSTPQVKKFPLHFIPYSDTRLRHKYSIMVQQYAISEKAYTFIKTLEKQNENQGELFTTQPFQIRGNLTNIDDPTEPVLGYFLVASGKNGNRILTKAPDRIRYNIPLAFADTSMGSIQNTIRLASPSQLPIYFTFVYFENPDDSMGEALEVLAYVRQDCLDCTRKGGKTVKPYYWDW